MNELEMLSERLENLLGALSDICEVTPNDSPIYRKCDEMKEYIDSCLRFVDHEIDKIIDAGTV